MISLLTSPIADVLENTLVPIFVCVVLPSLIVFLVMWQRRNEVNRKTEVALKAIETGAQVDPNFFAPTAGKKDKAGKSLKMKIFKMLRCGIVLSTLGAAFIIISVISKYNGDIRQSLTTAGIIILALGLGFTASYFIARKQFAAEIKAEEDDCGAK